MLDLAHDAFTAQAFTGHLPGGLPEDRAPSAVCALDENRLIDTDSVKRLVQVLVQRDYATTFFPTGGGELLVTGEMTLAGSPESRQYKTLIDNKIILSLLADQFQSTLSRFRGQLQPDMFVAVERRLPVFLDSEEFESGDAFPNLGSFVLLLRFLVEHPEFQVPRVSLSRRGYFVISWRAAREELVTLQFQSDGIIRWLVFAPPLPGKIVKERASGDSSSKSVLRHIASFGALKWMKRAE